MRKTRRSWLFAVLIWAGAGWYPAWALDEDAAFMAAREAFQKGRIERLDELALQLAEHPLYSYVAYWQLRGRLAEAPEPEVRAFLTQQSDTLAAQRLRADWLKQLGERRDWNGFERENADYILDDVDVSCYALQARLARGDASALGQAKPLWFQGAPQPESCGAAIRRDGGARRDHAGRCVGTHTPCLGGQQRRVSPSCSRPTCRPTSASTPAQLDSVARKPQKYLERRPLALKTRAQRELAMFATWKVAQSLPAVAAARLEKYREPAARGGPGLRVGTACHGRSAEAQTGSARLVQACGFDTGRSAGLSDRQLAWKTRTGLRTADWSTVLSAIEAMSEREQQLAVWRYWKARALMAQNRSPEANALLAPLSFEHQLLRPARRRGFGHGRFRRFRMSTGPPMTKWRSRAHARAFSGRCASTNSDCAMRARWSGAGARAPTTTGSCLPRPRWHGARAGTSAPSTPRSARSTCTTSRCASPHRIAMWSAITPGSSSWRRRGSTAWYARKAASWWMRARAPGAQGLMQLMPATARQLARRMGCRP